MQRQSPAITVHGFLCVMPLPNQIDGGPDQHGQEQYACRAANLGRRVAAHRQGRVEDC